MFYGNELRNIHNIATEILESFIELCDKHDLEYFAIVGTALGAVKYKGFIPWDDDIDIGMTREDYNKFIEIAKIKLPKKFFLQNFHTEYDTPFYYSKVRAKNTEFVEKYYDALNINKGIFIDIFPIDNIPDNKILEKIQYAKSKFISNIFIAATISDINSNDNNVKSKVKRLIRRSMNKVLKNIDKNKIFYMLEKEFTKYNNKSTKRIGRVNENEVIRRKYIYPFKQLEFEGLKINIPGDYHKYLTNRFGDYMKPPKEEDIRCHKPCKVIIEGIEYKY
ncbi:LicD family protein [Clostridium sp. Ade.TY]|uniref:LicD family protein n=1 Tax=Clostridium sp. Ade.TY TaxID=1391647 RepID=UPI0003FC724A|nr:LicD family protein [Clostridium sp. Ade.TY]